MKKRLLAMLLMVCMVLTMLPLGSVTAFAEEAGDFTVTGGLLGDDYTYENNILTIKSGTSMTITGTTTKDRIVVSSVCTGANAAKITLSTLNIVSNPSSPHLTVESGAAVTVTLVGENYMGNNWDDGSSVNILVQDNATLSFVGDGSLFCNETLFHSKLSIGTGAYVMVDGPTVNMRTSYTRTVIGTGTLLVNSGMLRLRADKYDVNLSIFSDDLAVELKSGVLEVYDNGDAFGGKSLTISGGQLKSTLSGCILNPKALTFSGGVIDFAGGIDTSLQSDTSAWNGTVVQGSNRTVYGNITLESNLELSAGQTLTVLSGATLTIPDGVTLTNNGTITNEGTLTNNGILLNNGTIDGAVEGIAPMEKASTGVTFAIKGAPETAVTTAEYGQTVLVTATAQKNTALRSRSVAAETMDFYLGDAENGTKLNDSPIATTYLNGSYTATFEIQLTDSTWTPNTKPYTITATFGGDPTNSLQPGIGSGTLTVTRKLEAMPEAFIDYQNDAFGGLLPEAFYIITIGDYGSIYRKADTNGKIYFSSASSSTDRIPGNTVQIAKEGNYETTADSPGQVLEVPARQEAPSGVIVENSPDGRTDGKIKNVDTTMEYQKNGDSVWTKCTSTEITNLTSGTYFVRYQGVNPYVASKKATLFIGKEVDNITLSISDGAIYIEKGSGTDVKVTANNMVYLLPQDGVITIGGSATLEDGTAITVGYVHANIVFDGLNLTYASSSMSTMVITKGGSVDLLLKNTNSIVATESANTAIDVQRDSSLTIDGKGSLTIGGGGSYTFGNQVYNYSYFQYGIGGEAFGNVTIAGGTLEITAGVGIGGCGDWPIDYLDSRIYITGGKTTIHSEYACIGSTETRYTTPAIHISGGVVIAYGSTQALTGTDYGIGVAEFDASDTCETIQPFVISGGTVVVASGMIMLPTNGKISLTGDSVTSAKITPAPVNVADNAVFPVNVSATPGAAIHSIYLEKDGASVGYGSPAAVPDSGKMTLYLPAGTYSGYMLVNNQLMKLSFTVVDGAVDNVLPTDTGTTITLPEGTKPSVDADGKITLPAGSITTLPGESSITIPGGGGVFDPSNGETTFKDKTAPIVTITVGENSWNKFWNTVTFGLFCKETQTVTISAADTESGVDDEIYYYLSETALTETAMKNLPNDEWIKGKSKTIAANWKGFVYAKAVDGVGNIGYASMDGGLVVYKPVTITPTTTEFNKELPADLTFTLALNGSTIKELQNNGVVLKSGTDYTVSGSTVTIKKEYLTTALTGTDITLVCVWNPMGEETPSNIITTSFTVTSHVKPPYSYDFTSGQDSEWDEESGAELSFTIDGDFDKLVGIRIDGQDVGRSNYGTKRGSTIITLKSGYLKTLSAGKHTLTVVYEDITVSATFTVKASGGVGNTTGGNLPQTGDNSNPILWVTILLVSGSAMTTLLVVRKRRKHTTK